MNVQLFFATIRTILVREDSLPVYRTIAEELSDRTGNQIEIEITRRSPRRGELRVQVDVETASTASSSSQPTCSFRTTADGGGSLEASKPYILFSTLCYLLDYHGESEVALARDGKLDVTAPFSWNRPVYDSMLTQLQRTARGFDWKSQIRAYAMAGFSHVEVNALSTGMGIEPGVPGEVYPVFYTYCPALDQYSSSKLNRGCYPEEYLSANMALLKRYATEALRYGMKPGMLCFEPRNAPDQLLERYPMLRGARVDHPFRSFKPRYSLAISHPYVRHHYRELLLNVMREVPEMDYVSVTTNDSGAGFEFTRSLYVGSNGGPYLVREWKSVDDVAKVAAKNAVSYYELLRDVASEINPDFRVIMRLEPFGIERPYVLESMGERIDIEGSSFEHTGYGFSYHHDLYEDVLSVQNTVWHNRFRKSEADFIAEREKHSSHTHVFYTFDGFQNFDPLLAIPTPWMVAEKLGELKTGGCTHAANLAGITPPSLARWDVNREILRLFSHDPDTPVDVAITSIAKNWVSTDRAQSLVDIWHAVQESVRAFPPAGLYTSWGMGWYKLWIRPLVPDIDAIPEEDRAYYERFLLATPHNPNRVDLNMDILFELGGPVLARKIADRIDDNAFPPLLGALRSIENLLATIEPDDTDREVFIDLFDRLRGLKAWYTTQRNVQAWIAGVHGYLSSNDPEQMRGHRKYLDEMMDLEISNTKALIELVRTAEYPFMVVADLGESVHMYGDSLVGKLETKIDLMNRYRDREPRIDPKFIWRVPGIDFYDLEDMPPGATPLSGQLDDA